jgi:hypothetical protein
LQAVHAADGGNTLFDSLPPAASHNHGVRIVVTGFASEHPVRPQPGDL